jgi:hypothetical protein
MGLLAFFGMGQLGIAAPEYGVRQIESINGVPIKEIRYKRDAGVGGRVHKRTIKVQALLKQH